MRTCSGLVLLLAAFGPAAAQHGNITAGNPASSQEDRAAGARMFRVQCAGCHGLDGSGSAAGSNLTTGVFRHGSSDEALFRNIAKGIPGTAMAATALEGREIWRLVTFVRSLSIGKGAEQATGDPTKGAHVFETAGCRGCHAVSGKGGLLGPDLTGIGARRSLAELERSVVDPSADVAPDFWSLRAQTPAGERITGIRLNEDTYSVQILDAAGRLRSLSKEELAEYQMVRTSPMPSFKGKLRRDDLEDVIAYLARLRETQ